MPTLSLTHLSQKKSFIQKASALHAATAFMCITVYVNLFKYNKKNEFFALRHFVLFYSQLQSALFFLQK